MLNYRILILRTVTAIFRQAPAMDQWQSNIFSANYCSLNPAVTGGIRKRIQPIVICALENSHVTHEYN